MNNSNNTSCMKQLRGLDFALIETALFLNTHPDDKKALAYFNKLTEERNTAFKNYTEKCGTLTLFDGKNMSAWDWATTPWPWEMED